MSQIVHTDELVTKNELKEFYNRIYPYLNGVIGVGGGYAPIGTIISYMGTTAPQDYLVCDGTTYNIADYQQLATFFATQFGSSNFFGGDGITTFKVPDLRGEFLRGTGTNGHIITDNLDNEYNIKGANVGEHQDGTIASNAFINTVNNNPVLQLDVPENWSSGDAAALKNPDASIGRIKGMQIQASIIWDSSNTNAITRYTSRPTNTSILWCIKAIDAGEVYSTTERRVGTWIDGKPLYQKTCYFKTPTVASDTFVYTLGNDIDIAFIKNGFMVSESGAMIPLLDAQNGGAVFIRTWLSLDNGVRKIKQAIRENQTNFQDCDCYCMVCYTKTTD